MFNRRPAGPATKSKNRNGYAFLAVVSLALLSLDASVIAQGVVNPANGHRYEYVRMRSPISWHDARAMAESQGGYLATIIDSIEAGIVTNLLSNEGDEAWLGASDEAQEGTWVWITGEPWDYTNWYPGEPNAAYPNEDYLLAQHLLGGRWVDVWDDNYGLIIEYDSPANDTLMNLTQWPVSQGGNGHWYAVIPQFISWNAADSLAKRIEIGGAVGHLATITSPIENDFVLNNVLFHIRYDSMVFLRTEYWLGGYFTYGGWQWVTGEPFDYSNWGDSLLPGGPMIEPVIAMVGYGFDINPPLPGTWVARMPYCDPLLMECRWAVVEFDTPADSGLIHLVQWPVSEGGNGHWYAYLPNTMSWDQARIAAMQFEKDGVAGHLATVTSPQENDFIFNNLVLDDSRPLSGSTSMWLGGYDDTLWVWVTGEPFIYTNWGYGEPRYTAVVILDPPAMGCPLCPQPGDWITLPKESLLGSIVEFDFNPTEPHVLYVPDEYPTIQAAIDAAQDGDRVLVYPGTYFESINFLGKNITVRGADGPLQTTITNERTVNLVTFNSGESHAATLEGFTLRGGWIAVLCVNSAPTIRRNICVDQNVWNWAAICLSGPLDTLIEPTGDPRYHANFGDAPAILLNNTIVSCANGGVSSFSVAPPTIKNNIIAFNGHYGFHHQGGFPQAPPDLSFNDVFGNPDADYYNILDPGPGSFSLDPLFGPEYTLSRQSPCIDAGDPNPRFNDPDSTRNDMGAMPFMGGNGGGVIPTDQWIVVFCDNLRPDVLTTPQTSVIRAYDPSGVLCGEAVRHWEGTFGFMPIYRDDPYTDRDEGCEPGDLIQFLIDGMPVQSSPPVYWTANGDVFEVCDFGYTHCLNIPLHEGWNLISWNVAFESEIYIALDEIIGCVDIVHSFEQGGLVFDPNLDMYNTLTHLDYHHGYWIRLRCDAVLQVCGDQIRFEEWITLEPGWNLVSYWPEWPLPVETGFNSILDQLQEAMGFDNGAQIWLPGMDPFNTLHELRPSFGYWTKVSDFAQLVYPRWFEPWDTLYWPPDSGYTESPPLTETSRSWMSAYGDNLTVDGRPIEDGAVISFGTSDDIPCGRGVYQENTLRMTPVYGLDASGELSKKYPKEGDRLAVYVDDTRVYPDLLWIGSGERVRLSRLTEDPAGLPQSYALDQNYPNPFNPSTMIGFDVATDGHVNLSVFNVLGQKVRTLTDQHYFIGRYEREWDGKDDTGAPVSTGVYFYRLTAGESTLTKKMMLLK